MNIYEMMFILDPSLNEPAMEALLDEIREIYKTVGASIKHEIAWGIRKLAYRMKFKSSGYYHIFYLEAEPSAIVQLEPHFKFMSSILRYNCLKVKKILEKIEFVALQKV